jgi:hypothetical protein
MSITVKNLPYDGLTAKINPVYNGLGFVVDSNYKTLNNYKYIAEIFVEGNKVGELRHNPDISNNNYGIFDIGRVVESYLSYDLNWDKNIALAKKSMVEYYVRFGEEFGRVLGIKSYSNSSGKLRLNMNSQHPLNTGDVVLLQGVTGGLYDGFFANGFTTITKSGTSALICDEITYETGLNMSGAYVLTGEKVNQWLDWTDTNGVKKVRLKVKANSSLKESDLVYIEQPIYNNSYRNVEWVIERKTSTSTYTYLDISCPFGVAVPSFLKGYVVSRDNYLYLNQFSTQNHKSKTFNGVEQYENWLDWNPNQYLLTSTSGKFLTKRPDRSLDICLDEWMTLSMFGRREMTDFILEAPERVIVETWQDPATAISESINEYDTVDITGKLNRLSVKVTPDITSDIFAGDYVDITTDSVGTIRARVISFSYSALFPAGTTVILDYDFDPLVDYQTFTLAIHAINNTYTAQNTRFDMGAGPKNLNLPEINDGSAYKYFIYTVSVISGVSLSHFWRWTTVSETWTFNIKCSCSKFKKWTVVWLNELGGFDFYNFDKRNDKVRTIERNQFRRHLKSYSTANGYKYTLGDRGRTTYNTQSKDQIVLRTGFINQEYIDWLQWAFESPEVYIIDNETDKIYPVNCIDSDVELLNKVNMGAKGSLYIYEITLEMANNRVVQRGGSLPTIPTGSTRPTGPTEPATPNPNGPFNPGWNTGNNGVWQTFNDIRGPFTGGSYE